MKYTLLIISTILLTATTSFSQSLQPSTKLAKGILVQLKNPTDRHFLAEIAEKRDDLGISIKKEISKERGIYLLETSLEKSTVLQQLQQDNRLLYVSSNRPVEFRNTEPNDPFYGEQWHYEKIGLPQVWDYTTGGQTANGDEIVVAVVDSGFNPNHPDFAGQIWANPIDFAAMPNPRHGTAVTGFIGAKGNNEEGITGVNWDTQLMLLSAHFENQIAEAYLHIYEQRKLYNETNGAEGAFVVAVNGSFGFKGFRCNDFPILRDLIEDLGSVGILYVGAAPNEDWDINERGDFPTECPSDYLISVTSTTREDQRSENAAFGQTTIDLGAPGSEVFTTNQSGGYQIETLGGTSFATPHVSGAVALLYSVPCLKFADLAMTNPSAAALLIKEAILNGVDEVADLQFKTVSGGRLNVFNSMNYLHGYCIARAAESNFEDTYLYDKDLVRLYPNPSNDFIKLDYAVTNFKPVTIKIYDILGRLMYQETTTPIPFETQSLEIDLNGWASGTYFVTILGFEQASTRRFLKVG